MRQRGGTRQLHCSADDQRFLAVFGGGANDRTGVVDGESGRQAELRLRKMKQSCDQRKKK
ncbi:MAG: hypothetical protein WCE61_04915 [Candidatus Acidiferrum sp.]